MSKNADAEQKKKSPADHQLLRGVTSPMANVYATMVTKQMAVMKYDTYMCVIWPTMIHVETNHGALGDYGNKMRYHWSHNWRIVIISLAADALILINLW